MPFALPLTASRPQPSFSLDVLGLPSTLVTALPVLIVLLVILFKFIIVSDEAGAGIATIVVLGGVTLAILDLVGDGWISSLFRSAGLF